MQLSDRERKILWTQARNQCSFRWADLVCARPLVLTAAGSHVVVGQECHIVGERSGAARYLPDFPDRETYGNAILLCPDHHKVIDDDQSRDNFPVEVLREMKLQHEQAVLAQPGRVEIIDSQISTEASDCERAIGADISRPTTLSNVRVNLKAQNVHEAVGLRTGPLTVTMLDCDACGAPLPAVYTGPRPESVPCPRCGHRQRLPK